LSLLPESVVRSCVPASTTELPSPLAMIVSWSPLTDTVSPGAVLRMVLLDLLMSRSSGNKAHPKDHHARAVTRTARIYRCICILCVQRRVRALAEIGALEPVRQVGLVGPGFEHDRA